MLLTLKKLTVLQHTQTATSSAKTAMNDETLKQTIETHFAELLNTHMAQSPMLNAAIRVEATGFSKWESNRLCVVITPWFMGLLLIREESDNSSRSKIENGTMTNHRFPCGSFTFTAAQDDAIGHYETCTLFTSMSAFISHSAARDVALETVRLLLEQKKGTSIRSRAQIIDEPSDKKQNTPKAPHRRNLFRSAFRRGKNA